VHFLDESHVPAGESELLCEGTNKILRQNCNVISVFKA
jgi:hypothetical protein